MSDPQYGVFITYQDPSIKVTITREQAAEAIQDLEVVFGEAAAKRITARLANALDGAPQDAGGNKPQLSAVPTPAPQPQQQASAPADVADDADVQEFELCSKCGSVKDKWVPPGVSRRTGKSYPGFFGCSNPTCR